MIVSWRIIFLFIHLYIYKHPCINNKFLFIKEQFWTHFYILIILLIYHISIIRIQVRNIRAIKTKFKTEKTMKITKASQISHSILININFKFFTRSIGQISHRIWHINCHTLQNNNYTCEDCFRCNVRLERFVSWFSQRGQRES